MRKLKYILLLSVPVIFFASCLKNSPQVPGPAGATGATGAPGGILRPITTYTSVGLNNLSGSGPYSFTWIFSGYNPKLSYMLSAYVSKVNGQSIWYKLPYANVYTAGDELSTYMSRDTVTISYSSSSPWPSPDSTIVCRIIVIPQQ